ncbi:MAG: sugar phosphate isomerase/epimerase [Caldilineaceae bacterium]|nr:sugar phosphate isomerase/epimerase [Caldilineaceae bacterium]
MKTRTGNFPIGFRQVNANWNRDIPSLLEWAVENRLEAVDLTTDPESALGAVSDAGLRIGSIDLPDNKGMIAADPARRAEALARNSECIRACTASGPQNFFAVMLPEDPALPRLENYGYMVESFAALADVLEESGSHYVIEGWPGPGALCCTPETYRAFFRDVPSPSMSVNYDPSHLIRMGIDPLRFLTEFVDRVHHVHGKDTEILEENMYVYGHEQPATFAERIAFGAHSWRYTIPGQGLFRWGEGLRILAENGYGGAVSIELEDSNFNGAEESEKWGILHGARFLAGC